MVPTVMEYKPQKVMQDDYLKIVRFLSSDIFQPKIMKFVIFVVLLMHIVSSIITAYGGFYELTGKQFIPYSPVFFGDFFGIVALFTLLWKGKLAENFRNEWTMWTIDSGGEEIETKIKLELKVVKIYIVFAYGVGVIASILFSIPVWADDQINYLFFFTKKYLPEYENMINYSFRISYLFIGYTMLVHGCQTIYTLEHARLQIMMFTEYLTNLLNFKEEIPEQDLYYDETHQQEIAERLSFCVVRHQEFLAIHTLKMNQMGILIMIFSICGGLLGLSFVLFIFTDAFIPEYYPRVFFASLASSLIFIGIFICGQSLEDQGEDTTIALFNIAWYNLNKRNKNTFKLLALNMMQPWKIQFSEKYSVNYQLGRAIVQGIYSVMSVMINFL